jgi:hypothetical protein
MLGRDGETMRMVTGKTISSSRITQRAIKTMRPIRSSVPFIVLPQMPCLQISQLFRTRRLVAQVPFLIQQDEPFPRANSHSVLIG